MATNERIQAAKDFLEASDREFDAGDNRQASEKLWGAATQMVMALAEERGWDCESDRAMKQAAGRLALEYNDPFISYRFSIAEKFQANSVYNFMEDFELEGDRPLVREFVEQLLAYHDRC